MKLNTCTHTEQNPTQRRHNSHNVNWLHLYSVEPAFMRLMASFENIMFRSLHRIFMHSSGIELSHRMSAKICGRKEEGRERHTWQTVWQAAEHFMNALPMRRVVVQRWFSLKKPKRTTAENRKSFVFVSTTSYLGSLTHKMAIIVPRPKLLCKKNRWHIKVRNTWVSKYVRWK